MTRPYLLESFDELVEAPPGETVSPVTLEEARLAAYENGYAEGWDDAAGAQDDEIARLRADLGQNLRAMALTYGEARNHVLRAMEPLLKEMVCKVLPQAAQAALAGIVLETARPMLAALGDAPLIVRAHPANRAVIERLVLGQAELPLAFADEPSLSLGQVFLAAGASEASVDLDGVIQSIGAAVKGYFQPDAPQEACDD